MAESASCEGVDGKVRPRCGAKKKTAPSRTKPGAAARVAHPPSASYAAWRYCFRPLPVSSSTSASKNARIARESCANWSRSTIAALMLISSSDGSIAASGGSSS